jgi:hypothetical protein
MDFLKKIASRDTRASGGGNYFKQGRGRCIVKALKIENKEEGPTFIGEYVIESSQSYDDALNDKGQPEKANAPGSTVSWVQKLQKHKSAAGNVKAHVLAIGGDDEEDFASEDGEKKFEEGMKALFSKTQPATGMVVDYETYQKPIKSGPNAGKPITLIKWKHVPGQTAAEIAARRKQIESAKEDESAEE